MPNDSESPSPPGGSAPRNEFLDLVKGWLIFLVVCGHAIQFLGFHSVAFDSTAEYYVDPVYKGIYSFHMALFIGISGFLAWGAIRKRSFGEFTRIRAIQILLPLFIWSSARHLAGPVMRAISERDPMGLVHELAAFPVWELGVEIWFLWAAFICGVLVSAAQLLGAWRMLGFGVGFFILLMLPQGEVVKLTAFTYPFFVAGYLLAEKRITRLPRLAVILGAFGVWCVALYLWEPATFVYVSGMEWRGNLTNLGARYAGGIAGSIIFLSAVWWLSNKWKPLVVIQWGKQSLAIYIIQTYLFFPLMEMNHPLRNWKYFDVTVAPLFAALVCTSCVLIAWAVRKNRYLAFLLFGVSLKSKPR